MASAAQPVLHGLHLHVVPVLRKGVVDSTIVAQLAVKVGEALPHADGGKMLRLHARDLPLVDRVIGDAAQAYLAVAPGLAAGPLDARVEIAAFARRPVLDVSR